MRVNSKFLAIDKDDLVLYGSRTMDEKEKADCKEEKYLI